jgi:hypothetical protein
VKITHLRFQRDCTLEARDRVSNSHACLMALAVLPIHWHHLCLRNIVYLASTVHATTQPLARCEQPKNYHKSSSYHTRSVHVVTTSRRVAAATWVPHPSQLTSPAGAPTALPSPVCPCTQQRTKSPSHLSHSPFPFNSGYSMHFSRDPSTL